MLLSWCHSIYQAVPKYQYIDIRLKAVPYEQVSPLDERNIVFAETDIQPDLISRRSIL